MINVSDSLASSKKLRQVLGVILSCGNHMNATNKTRGDADGFDLAILPNLKDVKSKDNTTNLLQYIAHFYVNQLDDSMDQFPLLDPSDLTSVSTFNFDELTNEIRMLKNQLKEIEQRANIILDIKGDSDKDSSSTQNKTTITETKNEDSEPPSSPSPTPSSSSSTSSENENNLDEPFKTKINTFLKNAIEECKEQEATLQKCHEKFREISSSFGLKPKTSEKEVTPEYFFNLWCSFCSDFKEAWKKEVQKLTKLR
jgi:hypothetical protein